MRHAVNRLRSPTGKPVVLAATRPNAGLTARYQKRLDAMVTAMHRSLVFWLSATWRKKPPELAQDDVAGESAARMLRDEMEGLSGRWQSQFDKAAEELAEYFSRASFERSDAQLKDILRRGGFTVQFQSSAAIEDALQATIGEQVGLIKSIAQQHLSQVEGMVMRAVTSGGDLGTLTKGLEERYGVTRRRAAFIARDQVAKSNAVITRVRQQELGITTAKWLHSAGGRHPRPTHVAASGKTYDVEKGMYLDGAWIRPGELPNCRCVSRSIVPGFD